MKKLLVKRLNRNCPAARQHVSGSEDYRAEELYRTSFVFALITGFDDGEMT